MIQPYSWSLFGGLDLTTSSLNRAKRAGSLIGCMNYESRQEGYRRIDGYERFDGRKSPSNILEDEAGTELVEIEKRRKAITEVPGTGDILGVFRYRGNTYAFRKDSSDVVRMHKSSSGGWVKIDLGWQVAFTAGAGDAPENGEAIGNVSSVAGEVVSHYLTSGTWAGGDAAGILVFTYGAGTRFAESDVITVASTSARKFTISAVPSEQEITAGDRFRFVNYNFFGQSTQERMYGVSGSGEPFEYDGTTFLTLNTGVSGAFPIDIVAHENHLFIGYKNGSVIYSGIGNPRLYTVVSGGGEIAIGDILTGLVTGYKSTLFVFGRNSTFYISGTSRANFKKKTLSEEAGAMFGTSVLMDEPICLDDRGIRTVSSTEAFGDFSIATISDRIRPLLDFKRDGKILPVAAIRIRRKSQYRIFFDDGECLVGTYIHRGRFTAIEWTRSTLDLYDSEGDPEVGIIKSVCSVEDNDGRERVMFSMRKSGYVYEMDRGFSFDGHPIQAFVRLPYNDLGSPVMVKVFKKLQLECDSTFISTFKMAADYHDDRELGERTKRTFLVQGPSSYWDEQAWSDFYWGAQPTRVAEARLGGRGRNLSVILYSNQTIPQPSHVFTGITVLYINRRMQR